MHSAAFQAPCYDLAATLDCGQAFRWKRFQNGWEGIVGKRWVYLEQQNETISAQTIVNAGDWLWLRSYLQLDAPYQEIISSFPADDSIKAALTHCRGLRILKQDPWECLATFILSSTKQIVQIKQIVELLCERFGDKIKSGSGIAYSFPGTEKVAQISEEDLRACKMGFRAPYLKGTAEIVAAEGLDLEGLSLAEARERLMTLPGVGRKIADCVLLFAYGCPLAFPVDVWVMKAFKDLYFKRRKLNLKKALKFSESYFGPYGGYAQQYLFHYRRTILPKKSNG